MLFGWNVLQNAEDITIRSAGRFKFFSRHLQFLIRSHLKNRILVPRKKSGIFVKAKTDPSFNPQAYSSMLRT